MAATCWNEPLAMLVGQALTSSLYRAKPFDTVSYLLAVVGVAGSCAGGECVACRARGECRSDESAARGIEIGDGESIGEDRHFTC